MPKLAHFSPPAGMPDPDPLAWSERVRRLHEDFVDGSFPQFYDPTQRNTPPDTPEPMVAWVAFPKTVRAQTATNRERWRAADGDRGLQDEYCEWAVTRNAKRKITRVTFTTEVPEYFAHLSAVAPNELLKLYRKLVSPDVQLADLRGAGGRYVPKNRWNRGSRLAHLTQPSNNLGAAIQLAAEATVARVDDDGDAVTNQQALVRCAGLGEPSRNSDPQIASAVNVAAWDGAEIAMADPPGLHLGRPLTAGIVTPDGADAARFWRIERGDAERTLRARFEVPKKRGYVVGDLKIAGRPIEFGAQIADRVQVWVKVVVKDADHTPQPRPCGA